MLPLLPLLPLLLLAALFVRPCDPFVLEGSQTSYAQFRRWLPSLGGENGGEGGGGGPPSAISLEFLTSQPNGVLLYTDDGGYYDFLELKLVEGAARLRFSFGDGDARALQAGSNLADGVTWHRVSVAREGDVVSLAVDGQVNRVTEKAMIDPPIRNC